MAAHPPLPTFSTLAAIQNKIRSLQPFGHMLQQRLHSEATKIEPDLRRLCATANCLDRLRAELDRLRVDLTMMQMALAERKSESEAAARARADAAARESQDDWRKVIGVMNSDDSDDDSDDSNDSDNSDDDSDDDPYDDPYDDSDDEREDERFTYIAHNAPDVVNGPNVAKRGAVVTVVPIESNETDTVGVVE
ncbi:hypothetical protein P152DRAFT_456438 [Eremomyces bilateralis CBS 781.70]|uniref:Uncharacterized protein n=1 Tax=Eremomyces bilateralis CBS 781.70 TaxID=1392243 RepID=A0A6G1G846_9PEZI|nr:uncharacterized protein P152DRAFT_456438 [Eremomyces bilateralis CBS 781.70]KAF1814204.1 hypothetical protein P152DRAFT_456438 [Eremomyces bilateralis CBS 781.70]